MRERVCVGGGCVWEEGVWESVCVGGECGRRMCVGRMCVGGGCVCGREGMCVGGGYASHCIHKWFRELILLLQIKT